MKAIILARVSSKEQEENNSIPAQTRRLLDYCARKEMKVIETCQLVESSTKANRKKFSEVIRRISLSREPIALVVDTIDRLQRSFRESVKMDELRKVNKVELHFLRENLIINATSNSADILRWDMGVLFAKSYVTQLRDNVNRSMEEKRRNGELCTHAPFGYQNCRKDGKAFIEPNHNAVIVRKMFNLYASGAYSLQTLRDWLMDTYAIKKPTSTVAHILSNPFYYGFICHDGNLYAHCYETLITKEIFDKVQEVMHRMHKTPRKYRGLPFMYRSMITCAECGCRVTVEKQKGYTYYHCTQHRGKHHAQYIREENLDLQIFQALSNIQPTDEQFHTILEAMRIKCTEKSEEQTRLATYFTSEISKKRQRAERLFELYLDGELAKEEYGARRHEIDADVVELEKKLALIDNNVSQWFSDVSAIMTLVKNAPLLFTQSSKIDLKRRLLNLIFSNFELDGQQLRYKYKKPFDTMAFCANCPMWSGLLDAFQEELMTNNPVFQLAKDDDYKLNS